MHLRPIPIVLLLLASVGCAKTADQRSAGDRATATAEEQARAVGTTTITSAEIEPRAAEGADSGANAFLAEQADYRVRLRDALDALEQRSRSEREPADRVRRRAQRHDLLKRDLELVERSTEGTWATARAKIERDLRSTSAPQSPSH